MAAKRKRAAELRHQESGDGKHAVDAHLRVLIFPAQGGGYVAQGLEIDYLTTGKTLEEVRNNFARGLLRTIESYIKRNRSLDALFDKGKTPAKAWGLWLERTSEEVLSCEAIVALDSPENTNFFRYLSFRQAGGARDA